MKIVIGIIIGLILGLAGCIVPRFWNVDLFAKIFPNKIAPSADKEALKKTVPDPVVVPKDLELRRMIAEVAKQKAALQDRERPLAEASAKIDQERKALLALKQEIEDAELRAKTSVLEIDANEMVNLKRLAKTWAQMDPADAAKLARGIDLDFAVKILAKMTEKQTAGILGALTSETEGEKLAVSMTSRLKQLKSATLVKEK
ncbi:MAG: hypothetical protein WCT04_00505 [Planctomycetota bacterium]